MIETAPWADTGDDEYIEPEHNSAETQPELFYANLRTFVEDWVATVYLRKNDATLKWCPQWWAHPEAVVVLTALWEAWEIQRVGEPGSSAQYLVERFYPLMDRLTSATGTFRLCAPDTGHKEATHMQEPGIMPTEQAPAEILEYLGGSGYE